MEIFCSSTETIILSKDSTKFFEKIILELEIENKEYILSLFKRVKAIEKVEDRELDILYNFIISENFIKLYNEKISIFTGKKEKVERLEYFNMLSTFYSFMNKSKVIHILDMGPEELIFEGKKYLKLDIGMKKNITHKNKRGKIDLDLNNENYEKFRDRRKKDIQTKYKYLEYVNEIDDFLIGIDLRSGMHIVINKNSNEIILKSKELINCTKVKNYIFLSVGENKNFLLLGNFPFEINENIKIHYIGEQLFLINLKENIVYKAYGKTIFLGLGEIKEIKGTKITFHNYENDLDIIYDMTKYEFEVN